MKRLSIALAAIGLSASVGAFAALPAATDPTVVNVPQYPGGFFIGVTGYYLQASDTNGDLDYAAINTGTSPSFGSELKNIDPGYDWGWGANIGYIFPNTGNDVNLSYFHLDTDDSSSVTGTNLDIINPFTTAPSTFGSDWVSAKAKAEYDINQADLTAGQFINVGCRLILHPFTGLRWTSLDREITGTFVGNTGTTPSTANEIIRTKEESDYWGIGPIFGADASYYIAYGFGAVGHFDTAVLFGNIDDVKTNFTYQTNPKSATTGLFFGNKTDETTRVVPVVDAKLGLDYTYLFYNNANSDLTLEVGWQFTNYFNAVDRVLVTVAGSSDSTTTATIAERKTSDVSLSGPYVSLVFHA